MVTELPGRAKASGRPLASPRAAAVGEENGGQPPHQVLARERKVFDLELAPIEPADLFHEIEAGAALQSRPRAGRGCQELALLEADAVAHQPQHARGAQAVELARPRWRADRSRRLGPRAPPGCRRRCRPAVGASRSSLQVSAPEPVARRARSRAPGRRSARRTARGSGAARGRPPPGCPRCAFPATALVPHLEVHVVAPGDQENEGGRHQLPERSGAGEWWPRARPGRPGPRAERSPPRAPGSGCPGRPGSRRIWTCSGVRTSRSRVFMAPRPRPAPRTGRRRGPRRARPRPRSSRDRGRSWRVNCENEPSMSPPPPAPRRW